MGEVVRVVYIPWNGKSLVRVVYLLILKLFNVDQHISFKYNFSMFNFLCDGFLTIQPIRIHNQCYSMGETRSQGLLLCLHNLFNFLTSFCITFFLFIITLPFLGFEIVVHLLSLYFSFISQG